MVLFSQIGIITGWAAEARLARRFAPRVACAAASAQRAGEEAEKLVRDGARALLSFGIAGALAPDVSAGTLLLPATVKALDREWTCDVLWHNAWKAVLPEARGEALWAGGGLIVHAAGKVQLHQRSGAWAVDMESAAVAQVAARHGLPFLVLRAAADPASFTLPAAARLPLNASGAPDLPRVLLSLAKNPAQMPALLELQKFSTQALAALEKALGVVGPARPSPSP